MFNPKKPIPFVQENIDKIIEIKNRIAAELDEWYRKWEITDINTEWDRLFELYVSQDEILSKIENIP